MFVPCVNVDTVLEVWANVAQASQVMLQWPDVVSLLLHMAALEVSVGACLAVPIDCCMHAAYSLCLMS